LVREKYERARSGRGLCCENNGVSWLLLGRSRPFSRAQLGAELARRLSKDAPKRAIELGERLKPDVVGHLADASVGIEQLRPRALRAKARNIVGKGQAGALVKDFAEVKDARSAFDKLFK